MEADITSQAVGLASNTDFSIITAQEYMDAAISIIITDFTITSALKNKFKIEKSALLASPTACDVISASIKCVSH